MSEPAPPRVEEPIAASVSSGPTAAGPEGDDVFREVALEFLSSYQTDEATRAVLEWPEGGAWIGSPEPPAPVPEPAKAPEPTKRRLFRRSKTESAAPVAKAGSSKRSRTASPATPSASASGRAGSTSESKTVGAGDNGRAEALRQRTCKSCGEPSVGPRCEACSDAMSELKDLLLGGETSLNEPMDVRLD
jgi:hypothetical protein